MTRPEVELRPGSVVAVDPGGEHVGCAWFAQDEAGVWRCYWAGEFTPIEFEDWLTEQYATGRIHILVVEEWKLFADKAAAQTGSEMETSQLIGVIKYIHRMTCNASWRWPNPAAVLMWQPPSIKNPTRAMLRNRGIHSMAKKLRVKGDHAADAELHGFHFIERTLKERVK